MGATRKALPFHFVDVFAVEPLTGNPLVVGEDAADLTHELLQRIAREFNQSETTFLLPPTRPTADWRLRSFTPAGIEVFGAGGHNTLGAWWWLAEAGKLALSGRLTVFQQEIGDRVLPVTIAETDGRVARVEMDQQPASAGRHCEDVAGSRRHSECPHRIWRSTVRHARWCRPASPISSSRSAIEKPWTAFGRTRRPC